DDVGGAVAPVGALRQLHVVGVDRRGIDCGDGELVAAVLLREFGKAREVFGGAGHAAVRQACTGGEADQRSPRLGEFICVVGEELGLGGAAGRIGGREEVHDHRTLRERVRQLEGEFFAAKHAFGGELRGRGALVEGGEGRRGGYGGGRDHGGGEKFLHGGLPTGRAGPGTDGGGYRPESAAASRTWTITTMF